MKRYNNLYERICDVNNLETAYKYVRLGKRYDKEVLRFGYNTLGNIINIHNELTWKTYKVGAYREFTIRDPKERLIQYLPLRDRVVQQSLHQVIEPIFDKAFIADSFACRKGKGTHRALDRCQALARRHPYVLPCDIRQYFPAIDHAILRAELARVIADAVLGLKLVPAGSP